MPEAVLCEDTVLHHTVLEASQVLHHDVDEAGDEAGEDADHGADHPALDLHRAESLRGREPSQPAASQPGTQGTLPPPPACHPGHPSMLPSLGSSQESQGAPMLADPANSAHNLLILSSALVPLWDP